MQCCTSSKWFHLRCLHLSFARFKTLGNSHSWSCLPCFFQRSHTYQHCVFLLGFLQLVYLLCSTCSVWPPLLTQRSRPTLAFKPPTLLPPTSYLLPLYSPYPLMFMAVFLYLLFPLHPPTRSGFFNGMPEVFEQETLNYHTFISSHIVDLISIQEFNLNSYSTFWIPGFSALRSDRTHSRCGILSLNDPHASGDVIILVRQGLFSSDLSTSSLSSLDPYSDYVGVNISKKQFVHALFS